AAAIDSSGGGFSNKRSALSTWAISASDKRSIQSSHFASFAPYQADRSRASGGKIVSFEDINSQITTIQTRTSTDSIRSQSLVIYHLTFISCHFSYNGRRQVPEFSF